MPAARTSRRRRSSPLSLAIRHTEYEADRAVILAALSAEAPQHGVAFAGAIHRALRLRVVTLAPVANGLSAAVGVGEQIVAIVYRIVARADPGDRRRL